MSAQQVVLSGVASRACLALHLQGRCDEVNHELDRRQLSYMRREEQLKAQPSSQ